MTFPSRSGFPDSQRSSQWLGSALTTGTNVPLGALDLTLGPYEIFSYASVVVVIRAIGGDVTVTVTQDVPQGPPAATISTTFDVASGNTVAEAVVMLLGEVTVHLQGHRVGMTVDYAIVPANTNTNTEGAAVTQLGFQHNDVAVATETSVDFVDGASVAYSLADDPINLRMRVTPSLAQNGAISGSAMLWNGSAWVPTSMVTIFDTLDSGVWPQVGIGTVSPAGNLHVASGGVVPQLILERDRASSTGVLVDFKKARGTPTAPADVVNADVVLEERARPYSGGFKTADVRRVEVDGAVVSGTLPPLRQIFYVADGAGAVQEALRLDSGLVARAKGRLGSDSPTGGVGYLTGAGGAVVQATSKATGVALDTPAGRITMNAAALAAGASVSFVLSNAILAGDNTCMLYAWVEGGNATPHAYRLEAEYNVAGATLTLTNLTAGALAEAVRIQYVLLRSAIA